MKNLKRPKIFILFALAIGLVVGLMASYRNPGMAVDAQNQVNLTLRISTAENRFILRQPIPLTFDLSNPGSTPTTWNGLMDFGDRINLVIRNPDGSETPWKGDRGLGYPVVGNEILQPGQTKKVTRLISESFAEHLFRQPGRYSLRAEFIYTDYSSDEPVSRTIGSNSVGLEILRPTGRELAAYDYLNNVIDPAIRANSPAAELQARQHFLTNFSETTYWKYVSFELGLKYFSMEQYENAENVLYSISDIDFFHADEVKRLLQQLAIKLNRSSARSKRPLGDANPPVYRKAPSVNAVPVLVAPLPPPVVIPQPTPTIR